MPAYLKLGDIKGEATDPTVHSNGTSKGFLKIGDIKGESTDTFNFKEAPKDGGDAFDKIEWVFDSTGDTFAKFDGVDGESKDGIFAKFDGVEGESEPISTEEVTLGYTEVEWTY